MTSADDTDDGITLVHVPERHRYEVRDGNAVAGFVQYTVPDETHVDLIHTEVDDAYGGRGLAGRVVAFALADIRARDLRIIPHCPYVQSWLKKHPGYADVTDWPEA
ncbi:GNAT family N-acetyltransferase [Nocardioides terrisoli]|uniref:GNAT family N-acetyltransferase n=1 Tax=Nocardioides terrisoli TaxID=3388267 RepID=UPI00287B63F4|nr:GNAT family N-acetyltransferase [Nocardioides marmorisolisilvae]